MAPNSPNSAVYCRTRYSTCTIVPWYRVPTADRFRSQWIRRPRSREQERPKTQRSLLHRCHVTPSILVIPHSPPSQLRIKGSGASWASPGSEMLGGAQREGSQQRERRSIRLARWRSMTRNGPKLAKLRLGCLQWHHGWVQKSVVCVRGVSRHRGRASSQHHRAALLQSA